MPLWNKVKQELDRAGQVAQDALDEGKVRLDAFRARQLANKAAQAIGYAVYRARQKGTEVDADTYARLSSTLAGHEAEAAQLEERLDALTRNRKKRPGRPPGAAPSDASDEPGPAAGDHPPPA